MEHQNYKFKVDIIQIFNLLQFLLFQCRHFDLEPTMIHLRHNPTSDTNVTGRSAANESVV